jgi:hypothetical protein
MRLAWTALLVLAGGCPRGGGNFPQPSKMDSAKDVIDKLAATTATRQSFSAATVMDYWLGKDRAKGEVLVMGTNARQVRFNANSPDGSVLADMACDGTNFVMVNMQNNCQLQGPCNRQSIAQLLHVEMEPEDFFRIAVGTSPVIDDKASGNVTWDSSKGVERVELDAPSGKQKLAIDTRDGHFNVVSSERLGPDGKVQWSVENTDFSTIKDDKGVEHSLPGKTRFKSPQENADLIVDWKERRVNVGAAADPAKFQVPVPPNLPRCN